LGRSISVWCSAALKHEFGEMVVDALLAGYKVQH
jgi:hypothetical protein